MGMDCIGEGVREALTGRDEAVRLLIDAAKGARMALDMMLEGDSSCFATCSLAQECEESKTEECLWLARLEEVLASVEKPLPAEEIKPGRYRMTAEVIVENCCYAEIGCGAECRGLVYGLTNASVNRCMESAVNGGATFRKVE